MNYFLLLSEIHTLPWSAIPYDALTLSKKKLGKIPHIFVVNFSFACHKLHNNVSTLKYTRLFLVCEKENAVQDSFN